MSLVFLNDSALLYFDVVWVCCIYFSFFNFFPPFCALLCCFPFICVHMLCVLLRQSNGSQPPVTPTPTQNYETTFDVDGNVETHSTSSNKDETRSVGSSSRDGNRFVNLSQCFSFGGIQKIFDRFYWINFQGQLWQTLPVFSSCWLL